MAERSVSDDRDDNYVALAWYVAALVVYVVAGFLLKTVLLNWIVGPLFLLIVLHLVPTSLQHVRRARRDA